MSYQSTLTRKGQITIPKEIREILRLEEGKKLDIEFERRKREIRIKSTQDILELAGTFKPKRRIANAVKLREKMTKMYRPR